MPQVFHPSMNTISRVSIFGAVFFLAALLAILMIVVRSPYVTEADVIREQPVEFSHQHHVTDCGIDCRYCHTSVEDSHFAGMPSTETCMNCHAFLFNDAPILAPVRESYRTGRPIAWTRVHDVPDFTYFNHSIHVKKGIGCVTCHGQVDEMPLMWREQSLHMEWCLDCHRNPEQYIRPREFVFSMLSLEQLSETEAFKDFVQQRFPEQKSDAPVDPGRLAESLIRDYHVQEKVNCSICHR